MFWDITKLCIWKLSKCLEFAKLKEAKTPGLQVCKQVGCCVAGGRAMRGHCPLTLGLHLQPGQFYFESRGQEHACTLRVLFVTFHPHLAYLQMQMLRTGNTSLYSILRSCALLRTQTDHSNFLILFGILFNCRSVKWRKFSFSSRNLC